MLRKREGRIEEALLKARLDFRGGKNPQELESRTANPDDIKLRIGSTKTCVAEIFEKGCIDPAPWTNS